jgi:hypothetical protein
MYSVALSLNVKVILNEASFSIASNHTMHLLANKTIDFVVGRFQTTEAHALF